MKRNKLFHLQMLGRGREGGRKGRGGEGGDDVNVAIGGMAREEKNAIP